MWQALCFTGRGFDTCWRPGTVAACMVQEVHCNHDEKVGDQFAYCTPIRLHR